MLMIKFALVRPGPPWKCFIPWLPSLQFYYQFSQEAFVPAPTERLVSLQGPTRLENPQNKEGNSIYQLSRCVSIRPSVLFHKNRSKTNFLKRLVSEISLYIVLVSSAVGTLFELSANAAIASTISFFNFVTPIVSARIYNRSNRKNAGCPPTSSS